MIIDANMHYREAMKEVPLYRERERERAIHKWRRQRKKTKKQIEDNIPSAGIVQQCTRRQKSKAILMIKAHGISAPSDASDVLLSAFSFIYISVR